MGICHPTNSLDASTESANVNRYEIPGMLFAFLLVVGAIAVIGQGVWMLGSLVWALVFG